MARIRGRYDGTGLGGEEVGMAKERITIEIENHNYDTKKEFTIQLMMDGDEFLALVGSILDYINLNKLEEWQPKDKETK